jgi:toxin ParE2
MNCRILDEAATEVDDAVAFYNGRAPGLGAEFATEVQAGIRRIEAYPLAWPKIGRRVRRYRLNRFPYGLVYAVLPGELLVVAVMHMKRKPGYWRDRL